MQNISYFQQVIGDNLDDFATVGVRLEESSNGDEKKENMIKVEELQTSEVGHTALFDDELEEIANSQELTRYSTWTLSEMHLTDRNDALLKCTALLKYAMSVEYFLWTSRTHWLLPVFLLNISSDLVQVGRDLTLLYKLCYTKPTGIPMHFSFRRKCYLLCQACVPCHLSILF